MAHKDPEKGKAYRKAYYEAHREEKIAYSRQWRKDNAEHKKDYAKKYYVKNAEHLRKYSKDYMLTNKDVKVIHKREARAKLRLQALDLLGGKCVRCGYSDVRALQIDHISGGGNKEMETIGTMGILRKVVNKESIGEYQLLCANCNWIKRVENLEYIPSKWAKYG